MKVTNISTSTLYLKDLRLERPAQGYARKGEDRYLGPGLSAYLPNTSEVLRSAAHGDLRAFVISGRITLEDEITLSANGDPGDTVTLEHDFNLPPSVYVLKQVSGTWVDGTGTVDIVHNSAFTSVTLTNTTVAPIVFFIRLM